MSVDRASARHVASNEGRRLYFCSAGCQAKFEAAPAQYLEEQPAEAYPPAGTKYKCPMHTEDVQDSHGDRTDESRVGQEYVRTSRCRWSPKNEREKNITKKGQTTKHH